MFVGRFSSSIGLVGVDLGESSIKLLQVREHQQKLDVIGAALVETTMGDSSEMDAEALTRQLQAAITGGGFTGRRCVVSLPRSDVRIQSIRLPSMPDQELRQAVNWEAAQRFGFDREALESDYIRTGATLQSGENREEVLLIAAPHAALHARVMPLVTAGLRPVAVDVHFSALARIFSRQHRREADRQHCRVVVEVGASGSTVMILRGDQIAFAKSVNIGGEQFDQAVVEHLQLEPGAARELRASRLFVADKPGGAPADDSATDRAVFEAVRPLIEDLVKEIVLCLRYYGVTFRGHPPDRIILSGGDSLEPRLDTLVQQTCKVPVAFDDEMSTMQELVGRIRTKLNRTPGPASCWSVAAGLSTRGLSAPRAADETPREARRGAA